MTHSSTKYLASLILALACPSSMVAVSRYETCIDSAEYYAGKEQFSKAADYYRMALRANPASPLNTMVFANLGMCLTETCDYAEALDAFEVALVRDPESPTTLTNQAKALLLSSRPAEALQSLERAIRADSLALPARRLHGQLKLLEGYPREALADFKVIMARSDADPSAMDGSARCHAMLGNHNEAAELFRKRLDIEKDQDGFIGLVTALINSSRLEEADLCVYEAINLYPRCGELYLLRGVIHNLHYRTQEAQTDRKTAISLGVPQTTADKAIPLIGKSR